MTVIDDFEEGSAYEEMFDDMVNHFLVSNANGRTAIPELVRVVVHLVRRVDELESKSLESHAGD